MENSLRMTDPEIGDGISGVPVHGLLTPGGCIAVSGDFNKSERLVFEHDERMKRTG